MIDRRFSQMALAVLILKITFQEIIGDTLHASK